MRLSLRVLSPGLLALALTACQTPAAVRAPAPPIERYLSFAPGADDWVRTELYFGFTRDGVAVVTEPIWAQFLKEVVTPLFPDGFTVVPAFGQWQNGKGKIDMEESRILVLFTSPSPEGNARIEAIRKAFVQRFGAESVLRVTSPAKVAF